MSYLALRSELAATHKALAAALAERDDLVARFAVRAAVEEWPSDEVGDLVDEAFRLIWLLREETQSRSVHARCTHVLGSYRPTAIDPPSMPRPCEASCVVEQALR